MSRIVQILSSEGPMLSGILAKKLISKYSISTEAARKEISRSVAPVRKLRNITFDNNQKFLYLDEHYQKPLFFEKLRDSIEQGSKAYWNFVKTFVNHYGFIDAKQLPAFTCSPIKPLKGHRPADTIIKDLLFTNLIKEFGEDKYELNSYLSDTVNFSKFKALELVKKTVVVDFADWARKIPYLF